MLCPASLTALAIRAGAQSTVTYNFGTTTPVATHTGGTYTNVDEGTGFSLGNSNGTVTAPINTTSPSSGYTGASGAENLGNAVKTGAFVSATSSYYTLTLTPSNGNSLSLSEFDFAARSTSTGPTTYALYASLDNYTTAIFSDTIPTTAAYALRTNAFTLNDTAGAALTLRLYTYGGAGNASSGTQNSRIDDVSLIYATAAIGGSGTTTFQYFDVNSTSAGSGVTSGGSPYTFSGANFNGSADGTGATAAFTNDGTATATFSAGTDATGSTYQVNIDTAVSTKGLSFEEGNVTLAHATNGSLTLIGATVNVASGATALISESIGGTVGLTKAGPGTLTLTGTNGYSGTTTINAGILSVGNDLSLGVSTAGIALGGGTLQTTASINTGRAFTGSGSLDIAPSTTLASAGIFNTSGVILVNTGVLSITNTGAGQAIGDVTFNATTTVANTGSALAVGNITVGSGSTGVATISGPVSLATGTHTFAVPDTNTGGVDLSLTGNLTGAGTLSKATGAGTLSLSGDNSGYSGTITLGGTTGTGGTISVGSANALGTSTAGTPNGTTGIVTVTGALNLDTGTLSNDTGSLVTTGKALSIGALATGTGAVLTGSDFNFTSNVALYKGAASQNAQQSLVVNNNTTISGNFTTSTGAGTSTGLTVAGTGTLTLTGANTFVEPLTISGVTLNAASTTGKALGGNTALNVTNGGTLVLSTANQANTGVAIGLNASTLRVNASQGSGATLSGGVVSGGSTVGLGALTLTANSTLNYGSMAATAVFMSFVPGSFVLNVTGTNFGTATDSADGVNNRLIFNQDISAAGLLGDITFNGVGGATETLLDSGFYEITPTAVPEPTTVLGGVLMVGLLGWNQRRRLRGLKGLFA